MKRLRHWTILAAGFAALAMAQDASQRVTVPFGDPAAPKKLEVNLTTSTANVTVHGVQRNDVQVEFSGNGFRPGRRNAEPPPGMHRLGGNGTLGVTQDNNVVRIGGGGMFGGPSDVDIQVPAQTAVTIAMSLSGKVTIDNVAGEIDVTHLNGEIDIANASGPVVAHSTNGRIVASLGRLAAGKSMSFSTFNGDIDVTLPADSKATLKARADNGDIFTDFDVKLQPQTAGGPGAGGGLGGGIGPAPAPVPPAPPAPPAPPSPPAAESDRTRREIEREVREQAKEAARAAREASRRAFGGGYVEGTINGGGTEIQFTTFNGRILIHKK